jgi:hypothetical protein
MPSTFLLLMLLLMIMMIMMMTVVVVMLIIMIKTNKKSPVLTVFLSPNSKFNKSEIKLCILKLANLLQRH